MSIQQGSGEYTSKKTGKQVAYTFEYQVLTQEEIDNLEIAFEGASKLVQRMLKLDANNIAREKAKTANGDSTRKPLTEAEKQANKQKRASDAELLRKVKEAVARGEINL